MSSVEQSQREEDSLNVEEQKILRNTRISRHRAHHRGGRQNEVEDELYHEAFRIYMFGGFKKASEKCKSIIAINPENPKPYFLLGTMHEEAAKNNSNDTNDLHKAVQYFFFDAFYSPPEIQKWLKIAEMSRELELYAQAAYCYGRALKMNNLNFDVSLRRAECLELCGETKKAKNIYERIIKKISNSVEVYKKYARLLFKTHDYSKARQILESYPMLNEDANIKYMICETLLRDRKYDELFFFIEEKVISMADPPIEDIYTDLAIPFIQMLFICCLALPDKGESISMDRLWTELTEQYEDEENPQLYEEIITHSKQLKSEKCFEIAYFLLRFDAHCTTQNYMLVSENLREKGNIKEAIKIIKDGLKKQRNNQTVELKTQLNYLQALDTQKRTRHSLVGPKQSQNFGLSFYKQEEQQIFESDNQSVKRDESESLNYRQNSEGSLNRVEKKEEEELFKEEEDGSDSEYSDGNVKKKNKSKKINKNPKALKRSRNLGTQEQNNPFVIQTLIKNTHSSLQAFKAQYENSTKQGLSEEQSLTKIVSNVKQSLTYIVELDGGKRNVAEDSTVPKKRNRGIFLQKNDTRRRRLEPQGNRVNFMTGNQELILQSLKCTIFFMKESLRNEKYEQVLDFAQMLSHAHFFKWQNKLASFKELKVQVYELAISACLSLKKLKKSLFFLRYLINKFPENAFYLSLLERVTRLGLGKLTLGCYLKKDMMDELTDKHVNLVFLRGVEEMDNSFFQLALSMFTKCLNLLENPQPSLESTQDKNSFLKVIYLCMSTCFLQLSSSRTVFNKLDYVNRSAFCFGKYKQYSIKDSQTSQEEYCRLFNTGRWFSQIKVFRHAIECFEKIISEKQEGSYVKESALNLMIIYREMEEYEKVRCLKEKFFSS